MQLGFTDILRRGYIHGNSETDVYPDWSLPQYWLFAQTVLAFREKVRLLENGDVRLYVPVSILAGCEGTGKSTVRNALMASKGMRVPSGEDKDVSMFTRTGYDPVTGNMMLEMCPDVCKWMMGRVRGLGGADCRIMPRFASCRYTPRLYWLFHDTGEDGFCIRIGELRRRLCLDGGLSCTDGKVKRLFPAAYDMIARVIEPARGEMESLFDKGLCDIKFDYGRIYEAGGRGRPPVAGLAFRKYQQDNKG